MHPCLWITTDLILMLHLWSFSLKCILYLGGGAFIKLLLTNENISKDNARRSKLAMNTPWKLNFSCLNTPWILLPQTNMNSAHYLDCAPSKMVIIYQNLLERNKKQGLFSEYIEAHRQKFRHFQAKKIDQKKSLRGLSTSLFKCCLPIEWSKTDWVIHTTDQHTTQ